MHEMSYSKGCTNKQTEQQEEKTFQSKNERQKSSLFICSIFSIYFNDDEQHWNNILTREIKTNLFNRWINSKI